MWRDSHRGSNTPVSKISAGDAAFNASKKSESKTKKPRKVNPFYVVVRRFIEIFGSYDEIDQNTANKRAALNLALGLKKKYYPDKLRFWQDLLDEANVLLDSKRFHDSCKKLGLDPQAVAEHLVVEGKAKWMKVLKDGLESYGEKVMMFKERLYEDKYNLYGKSENTADKLDSDVA